LPVADVDGLRPTSERIRETLFNWLAPVIDGAHCLDLFAGSGALGFEALSRGAGGVVFVENAPIAANTLRDNIDTLGATGARIVDTDAYEWLRTAEPRRFDIVFLDPPFAAGRYEELCRLLSDRGWLAEHTLVYIEQERDQPPPVLPEGWRVKKEKAAGNVRYALVEAVNGGNSR
jgi:16S rRNA (guanine966-N2)-methyltransferase